MDAADAVNLLDVAGQAIAIVVLWQAFQTQHRTVTRLILLIEMLSLSPEAMRTLREERATKTDAAGD